MIKVNVNDYARVQLTDSGRAIYRHWHEEQNFRAKGLLGPYKPIEEGNNIFDAPGQPCRNWGQNPFRLANLMELLRLKAESFCRLTELIGQVLTYLDEDQEHSEEKVKEFWDTLVSEIVTESKKLELRSTLKQLERIRERMVSPAEIGAEEMRELFNQLQIRVVEDLEDSLFLSISPNRAAYYQNPRKGWEEIISRFPNTVSDIEEASKCFALSRYAAAVFHSLQVLEYGLIELGIFLQVNDPHSGWTAVAKRLSEVIKKSYNDRTLFEKQHSQFLEQLQATVEALKNAWRNKISHAQGRAVLLTPDFTPDVAEEILFASRAFMRRLTDGIPLPLSL